MQAYNLTPDQWKKVKAIDRKIMSYKLAMDIFYESMAAANAKANRGK